MLHLFKNFSHSSLFQNFFISCKNQACENSGELKHNELKSWSQSSLDKSLPDWITKIHNFLRDWFSDNTHIKLQTSGTVAEKTYFLRAKKYLQFRVQKA